MTARFFCTSLFTFSAMVAAVAALTLAIGARTAAAASYKTCGLSERDQDPPGEVPTYNLSLKHQKTTCSTAKKVMKAFHGCRSRKGHTCTKRLASHWTCTGRKQSSIDTLFYANFTCKWGARRVMGSYQQTL